MEVAPREISLQSTSFGPPRESLAVPSTIHEILRSRPLQRADGAAVDDLISNGDVFEPIAAPPDRVFELGGRIIAACAGGTRYISAPVYQTEPVGPLQDAFEPGELLAYVGQGLVLAVGVDKAMQTMVHRLARTLCSQEHGARFCLTVAPLPQIAGFDAGGVTQQIAAGSFDHPPLTIPLTEGYWPVGVLPGAAVMVLRNDAF